MTYVLPRPPGPEPSGDISLELQIQRDLTEWFIAANQSEIALTPVRKIADGAGGYHEQNMQARPPQEFRIIAMSYSQKPTITEDGVEREIDLTLLGKWDAQVQINDWWRDAENQLFKVIELVPYNGYEVRALVVKHGHG